MAAEAHGQQLSPRLSWEQVAVLIIGLSTATGVASVGFVRWPSFRSANLRHLTVQVSADARLVAVRPTALVHGLVNGYSRRTGVQTSSNAMWPESVASYCASRSSVHSLPCG